jgi:hypothetical protein
LFSSFSAHALGQGKDERRTLKIKCGSVTRLHKEMGLYEAEVLTEAGRTEQMRAAGVCSHKLRQQARVAQRERERLPARCALVVACRRTCRLRAP